MFFLVDLILAEVQYRVIIAGQSCDKTVEITLPSVCYVLPLNVTNSLHLF